MVLGKSRVVAINSEWEIESIKGKKLVNLFEPTRRLKFSESNMKTKSIRLIIAVLSISLSPNIHTFEFKGNKWIGAETTIYANIPGASSSGIAWNTAIFNAALEWSEKTIFDLKVSPMYRDPCITDDLNSIKFASDLCGQKFNDATLAVTVLNYKEQQLGPKAIVEADIFVREDILFDVYDGDLRESDNIPNTIDFKRTVLHELGHVIGLDHEEQQPAVMQPELSNIYRLQPDDIAGVNKLYSGITNCNVKELKFGKTVDSLSLPDCTVRELTLGGRDESLIDLYSFKTLATTQLDFAISSNELESVLIIADKNLNYIAIDSDTSDGCGSKLKAQLEAGDYFLMVNTFDTQIKQQCELTGKYELSASYSSKSPANLNLQGDMGDSTLSSKFLGSITANGGETYGNLFSPQDSLDISASINIDPSHRGKDGFIIVAAVIDDFIMLLDKKGQFVEFSSMEAPLIPVIEKKLDETEILEIARDLVAENFDIQAITVDFFVGYGLIKDWNRVYTHSEPFNLTIAPSIEIN